MVLHATFSFLIKSSSKLLVTRTGIKAWTSSISGLWFPWPIYMFLEMRFDLGTLDSGERSLPFGLLVFIYFFFFVVVVGIGWGRGLLYRMVRWGLQWWDGSVLYLMVGLRFTVVGWRGVTVPHGGVRFTVVGLGLLYLMVGWGLLYLMVRWGLLWWGGGYCTSWLGGVYCGGVGGVTVPHGLVRFTVVGWGVLYLIVGWGLLWWGGGLLYLMVGWSVLW